MWRRSCQQSWNEMSILLKDYVDKNGDCCVPEKSCKLGKWVNKHRGLKNKSSGNHSLLTSEKISKFDAIGFSWKILASWDELFLELKEFKDEYSHC